LRFWGGVTPAIKEVFSLIVSTLLEILDPYADLVCRSFDIYRCFNPS
jgi:hypothetical protein